METLLTIVALVVVFCGLSTYRFWGHFGRSMGSGRDIESGRELRNRWRFLSWAWKHDDEEGRAMWMLAHLAAVIIIGAAVWYVLSRFWVVFSAF